MAVNSITIIIIIGEIQLESLMCCHYWNDGLPCSHCVNGQIGRPTGDGERMANYYNGVSRQAIGRQRSMWTLSGWKTRRGESEHLLLLLVLVIMLTSPKSCLGTQWLAFDMICHILPCSCRHWKLLGFQLCLLLHSASSHSHLCKPKQSSCLEQKTIQCQDKHY